LPSPIDIVEALLFASDAPLEVERMRDVLELADTEAARELVRELTTRYDADGRVLAIVEVGGGYRMVTRPDVAPWLVRLARARTRVRLSRPALETLAIIAYKQPISRAQVASIRGVDPDGVIRTLQARGYIDEVGRDHGPGQAILFGTTPQFLEKLGLDSLDDLPPIAEFIPDADVVEQLEHGLRVRPADVDLPEPVSDDGDGAP
jgi:segregation and condensation protein B